MAKEAVRTVYSETLERQNSFLVVKLGDAGHLLSNSTDIRHLLRAFRREADIGDFSSEIVNFASRYRRLQMGRQRLRIALTGLQRVESHDLPKIGMKGAGSLDYQNELKNLAIGLESEDRRMYPLLDNLRNSDPDILTLQIGGYQTELLLRVFGWSGWGERFNP